MSDDCIRCVHNLCLVVRTSVLTFINVFSLQKIEDVPQRAVQVTRSWPRVRELDVRSKDDRKNRVTSPNVSMFILTRLDLVPLVEKLPENGYLV